MVEGIKNAHACKRDIQQRASKKTQDHATKKNDQTIYISGTFLLNINSPII